VLACLQSQIDEELRCYQRSAAIAWHTKASALRVFSYSLLGDGKLIVLLVALTSRDSSEVSRDAALVHRLLHQDVNAFEQLYDRHSRIVYSLVLRILQQTQTAEEVVQDVFLQVWRNASQYQESRGPFVPWLLTMARNRALDTLRLKSERQRRREDQAEELPSISEAPQYEKELDQKRRAERVRSLMAQLSAPQQKAIQMAYFEGLSHTEIAAALKEPLGTVKSWIRNGLLRLKEGLSAVS
jgi:RNA polymerase sigma-70 factor, ECF subfamily